MNPLNHQIHHTSKKRIDPDRLGIIASVLCAIHCAVTPVLLIIAPTFGHWWSHPASHWLIAILVVPLAGVIIFRGFRIHGKRWIVASGISGIALVLVGAAMPYMVNAKAAETPQLISHSLNETANTAIVFASAAHKTDANEAKKGLQSCGDKCCPTIVTDEQNHTSLTIPPASIVTTLGGLALILTHVGNVCICGVCRRRHGVREE